MDDNQFFITLWKIVACGVTALALTVAGCTTLQSKHVAALVKAGTDPIAAHCAIHGISSSNAGPCALAATKERAAHVTP